MVTYTSILDGGLRIGDAVVLCNNVGRRVLSGGLRIDGAMVIMVVLSLHLG
jgi:hypothetical protein